MATTNTDSKAALDAFLAENAHGNRQFGLLDAALRDARMTMANGDALWLATLGYLVVLEVLRWVSSSCSNPQFPH